MEPLESRLSELFAAYREATPDPEAGADFSPGIWRRIDARRQSVNRVAWLARRIVTAAAAISLLFGVFLTNYAAHSAPTTSYVDTLTDPEDADLMAAGHGPYDLSR